MTIKFALCLSILLFPYCLSAQLFNFKKEYKQGFYSDASGKVEGYIYFSETDYEDFLFKKAKDGKKIRKYVTSVDGFEFDGRKFTVITNIEMKIGVWNIAADRAFAEIIVEGPLTLYKVYSQVGNGNPNAPGATSVVNYFIEKRKTKSYQLVHPNKKKFQAMVSLVFKKRPDLIEKVESGVYKNENIVEMVKAYNAGTEN